MKIVQIAKDNPLYALRNAYWRIITPLYLNYYRIAVAKGIRLIGLPNIRVVKESEIKIGKGSRLISHPSYTALGVSHPVTLRTLYPGAKLYIGNNVGISGAVIAAKQSIIIEDRVMIGARAIICDTDFHSLNPDMRHSKNDLVHANSAPVRICENAFIGANAIILKGVNIGAGAVIGAGSVVVKDVGDGMVVAGNPAKIISPIASS